jgi:hypothetical protein
VSVRAGMVFGIFLETLSPVFPPSGCLVSDNYIIFLDVSHSHSLWIIYVIKELIKRILSSNWNLCRTEEPGLEQITMLHSPLQTSQVQTPLLSQRSRGSCPLTERRRHVLSASLASSSVCWLCLPWEP